MEVITFHIPCCPGAFSSTPAQHQDLGLWWVGAQREKQQVKCTMCRGFVAGAAAPLCTHGPRVPVAAVNTSQQCCWTPRQGQAGVQWPVTICVEGSQQCQGALQTQSNTYIHIPPFSRGRATRWKSNLNTHELPLHLETSQLPNFLGRSAFRKAAFLPQRQPGNLFPQEQDTVVPLSLQAGGGQVSAHGASPPCY